MNNQIEIINNSIPLVREIGLMNDKEGILKHPNRIMKDLNVFIYVVKGRLQINENGDIFHLEKGSYLFLRKNIHHWGDEFYQPGSEWYFIHFFTNDLPDQTTEYSTYGKTSLIHREEFNTKVTLPKIEKSEKPSLYFLAFG
ncbi:hypothetical protein JCM21714_4080 [Gracilibacillus boraciitolerans JCM 21714]|uniref:Uncharacterized protein n=1 Tax=Gracilibacillus boraciitolerans JCM 21714 TaxID=1298598 RepID=W4VNX7_9BACI|nr:hypothetical protein [Gracilibacillus boraciitolerans]GAE94881.1 hypothetical protein JCM21714_4080 [Gracilibacillus boraciitolerans JCM 21714]